MDTANKLIVFRSEAHATQQDIADLLGISKSTYRRMERGEAYPDINQLHKLIKYYDITLTEFDNLTFPLTKTVKYPPGMLASFRKVIEENENPTHNWQDNHYQFKLMQKALNEVLDEKNKALDFPELNSNNILSGTTVKTVRLDIEGEQLIQRCLNAQAKLSKALFS